LAKACTSRNQTVFANLPYGALRTL
jgi:hypothetical protein